MIQAHIADRRRRRPDLTVGVNASAATSATTTTVGNAS